MQGKPLDPEAEAERRAKISLARQRKEAIRRGELEPDPIPEIPHPESLTLPRTHAPDDLRRIEGDQQLVGWLPVGGRFMERQYDSRTGKMTEVPADVGGCMLIPVLRRPK